jgi:Protein of unknown function (DUF3617)
MNPFTLDNRVFRVRRRRRPGHSGQRHSADSGNVPACARGPAVITSQVRRRTTALMSMVVCGVLPSPGPAMQTAVPQLYELIIETGMPHLEENLRYATTRTASCINTRDLSQAFPVLEHVSLQDCRLSKATDDEASAMYELQCNGGHGTTGEARWRFDAGSISGTLSVKLGGKNMTFYQRITGRAIGACASATVGKGQ